MRNDAELQRDVLDELLWDPSINATNVQVAANDGGVTLNGSIGSYTEMHAAERDARRVRGVFSVVNHLEVRLPPAYERTDADLVGAAKDALRWNTMVPGDRISVSSVKTQIEKALVRNAETDASNIRVDAQDGSVTLRGNVHSWAERDEAGWAAWAAPGVREVHNDLAVTA